MTTPDRITEEAAAWFVRQSDETMDWSGFTAWLEADPRHREAFDDLCRIDANLDSLPKTAALPVAANDAAPAPRWRYWAGGGAIAAGLALVLAIQPPAGNGPAATAYQSSPGEVREVAMADGTRVTLAPASRLTIVGDDVRLTGAAYFNVPHRPARLLTVHAGDLAIRDIGTRFEVASFDESVAVGVAEGQVSVAAPGVARPVRLTAGHGLNAEGGTIRLTTLKTSSVASWRQGKLVFDDVPLALAIRDVSRYSGASITVDPSIGDQRFSGVIAIHDGGKAARDIAQILAVDARPVAGGIRLEPRRH